MSEEPGARRARTTKAPQRFGCKAMEVHTKSTGSLLALAAAAGLAACDPAGPPAAGELAVGDCTIRAGEAACAVTIAWTTDNARSPRLVIGDRTLSTDARGTLVEDVGGDVVEVALFDGDDPLDSRLVRGTCASASGWGGARCDVFATRASLRAPTPFMEQETRVTLEVVVFRPPGTGPFPALLFHHGSTGNGDDPSLFARTYVNEAVARFFAERGWLVAFPQRRGRGGSDGLYDEGFEPDRSRYACTRTLALAGLDRALEDARAAVAFITGLANVAAERVIVSGTSRGGILSIAQSSSEPAAFRGALNFVGGWLGEGCVDAVTVNRGTFAASASFPGPTLWIYGENDPFYSAAHSRANFDAFVGAGGRGTFSVYRRAAELNGHFIANDSSLWRGSMDAFLNEAVGAGATTTR